ncbi:MAG: cob(I)yrinic acid a,c-diamide adenosyltransferase, partial [Bacteroidota bacterium]
MKIYTRRGDRGETSLFGGQKVVKGSLRIEAYGSVDELNSVLGVARSLKPSKAIDAILEKMQNGLFVLGADLATPPRTNSQKVKRVSPSDVDAVETAIDKLEDKLPKLASFILPGGTQLAA